LKNPLDDLKPSEPELTQAYLSLIAAHTPRSVPIANTGMHACVLCDEVWPCETAIVLAGFREFRNDTRELATITMTLADIAFAAAQYIGGMQAPHITEDESVELLERLTVAIQQMAKRRKTT